MGIKPEIIYQYASRRTRLASKELTFVNILSLYLT